MSRDYLTAKFTIQLNFINKNNKMNQNYRNTISFKTARKKPIEKDVNAEYLELQWIFTDAKLGYPLKVVLQERINFNNFNCYCSC